MEHNFGLQLHDLKGNEKEWKRLREVLDLNRAQLEQCVIKGSAPVFGYPTVLYEPKYHG